jgi:hypothetical protein
MMLKCGMFRPPNRITAVLSLSVQKAEQSIGGDDAVFDMRTCGAVIRPMGGQ